VGSEEEKMADVQEEEAAGEARDVVMTETETATTAATETETDAGALPTNDWSDRAQLRKVIRVNHCGAGDGSRTRGGRSVLGRATESKKRYSDQPFCIRNTKQK